MAIKERFTLLSSQFKVTGLNNMMCISVSVRMLACVCKVQLPSSCTVYYLSQIKIIWGHSLQMCLRAYVHARRKQNPMPK